MSLGRLKTSIFALLICCCFYANSQEPLVTPITIKGSQLTALQGFPVATIVAFSFHKKGGWRQIPMQIDERALQTAGHVWGKSSDDDLQVFLDVYSDPNTYNGPDPEGAFDENDEILIYLETAGEKADMLTMPEQIECPPLEVKIRDLQNNQEAFVYFFLHDYAYQQNTNIDLVDYQFQLLEGDDFLETYDTKSNNPEDSWIQTEYYAWHFSDDWVNDQWQYLRGPSPEQDLIDFTRLQLGPGICNRNIYTFSAGAGTHITSKDGPLRAIRSVMGANSGNLLQRTYKFYPSWVEIQTNWRVHPVRGIMENIDWHSDLKDFTYYNANHLDGLPMDGVLDETFVDSYSDWELISGPAASIWVQSLIESDFPIDTIFQYYLDEWESQTELCVGDEHALGQCGFFIRQQIPNTDPRALPWYNLNYKQVVHFLPPNTTPEMALFLKDRMQNEYEVAAHGDLECAADLLFYQVLPNPIMDDLVRVNFSSSSPVRLLLSDHQGRVLLEMQLQESSWVNLPSHLVTGVYFLHIENDHFHRVEKVLVLK